MECSDIEREVMCFKISERECSDSKQLKTVYMPRNDGHMTETYCGNNIRGGEEELLR
jgi:hypothetical protein